MKHYVSPTFTYEKLENASLEDFIDVFEDRYTNQLLNPAKNLLLINNGYHAAITLLLTYFEGIMIYKLGKDSKTKSEKYFIKGFHEVFSASDGMRFNNIAKEMYSQARCGFFHEGMSREIIYFTSVRNEALLCSGKKVEGIMTESSEIECIMINPLSFFNAVEKHFKGYIKSLREGTNITLVSAFEEAIKLKWKIDEEPPTFAMTEEEFCHNE